MPRRVIAASLALLMSMTFFTACSRGSTVGTDMNTNTLTAANDTMSGGDTMNTDATGDEMKTNGNEIIITIGGKKFTAILADTDAARGFYSLLPLTVPMDELNGNEKYRYLDSPLPADASRPDMINTGDLMLYGSSCIVLFYESFSTSYTYTALGHIADTDGLKDALGAGSVTVTFSAE